MQTQKRHGLTLCLEKRNAGWEWECKHSMEINRYIHKSKKQVIACINEKRDDFEWKCFLQNLSHSSPNHIKLPHNNTIEKRRVQSNHCIESRRVFKRGGWFGCRNNSLSISSFLISSFSSVFLTLTPLSCENNKHNRILSVCHEIESKKEREKDWITSWQHQQRQQLTRYEEVKSFQWKTSQITLFPNS